MDLAALFAANSMNVVEIGLAFGVVLTFQGPGQKSPDGGDQ